LNDYAYPLSKKDGELMVPYVVFAGLYAVHFTKKNPTQWRTEKACFNGTE